MAKRKLVRVVDRPLESDVERKFVKLLKSTMWWTIKINGSGERGKLDRMVLLPNGVACFIEFKRPGEKPTTLQRHHIYTLRAYGFNAEWFDDAAQAVTWLRKQARRRFVEV